MKYEFWNHFEGITLINSNYRKNVLKKMTKKYFLFKIEISFHTWNCTDSIKIGFVVARGGFLFLLYPPREIIRWRKENCKKKIFMRSKRFNTFFKRWVQFHVYQIWHIWKWVHLVLHPHRIALTLLKSDSWSPGQVFIPMSYHQGNKSDKEREIKEKS